MDNKKDQTKNNEEDGCELKIQRIPFDELNRNDLVFFQNDIWICESVNMHVFQNLQSKVHKKIPSSQEMGSPFYYLRVNKLELIPKQWSYTQKEEKEGVKNQGKQTQIRLKGQELGLGPMHDIEVVGMRRFQELQVVRSEKEKGRDIPFKVILCETKKASCYLIAGIDFLN